MKHYNFSVPLYSKEQIYVAMQTKEIVAALVASAFQIDVDIAKTEIVSHSKWGWRERILLNLAIKTKNGLAMADAAVFVCDNSEACACCRTYLVHVPEEIQYFRHGDLLVDFSRELYGITLCLEKCPEMPAAFYRMYKYDDEWEEDDISQEIDDGMHEVQINLAYLVPNAPVDIQDFLNVIGGAQPKTELGKKFLRVAGPIDRRGPSC